MNPLTPAWQPTGTVYGTLLNFRREWDLWSPRMMQDPHKPLAPAFCNRQHLPVRRTVLQDGVTVDMAQRWLGHGQGRSGGWCRTAV
jgi:5-oxopent-3-ene-1,2,5-tricarboxylate decarboxylase/2-hydroxyhepta-2,4-diene-1,7-dioate isomerase